MGFQLSLAARYLWGRKLRSFLTTLAIVIGVMVIFGMGTVLPTMMESFQQNLLALSGQADVTVTSKTGEAFSARMLDKVAAVDGLRVVAGSISRPVNLPPNFYGRDASVPSLTLVGIDPVAGPLLHDYTTSEGRFLKEGDGNRAVIRRSLADQLGLQLGDTLRMPTTEGVVRLEIVGLRPGVALAGGEEVLIPLEQAQKLLTMQGQLNVIEANLATTDEAQRQVIIDQIQVQLGSGYSINALMSGSEIFASIGMAQAAFNALGFLTLFMGAFIIFNTFRTIVAERRHRHAARDRRGARPGAADDRRGGAAAGRDRNGLRPDGWAISQLPDGRRPERHRGFQDGVLVSPGQHPRGNCGRADLRGPGCGVSLAAGSPDGDHPGAAVRVS